MNKFLENINDVIENFTDEERLFLSLPNKTCKYLRARRAKAIVRVIMDIGKEDWFFDIELLRSELGRDILAVIFIVEEKGWENMSVIDIMKVMRTFNQTFNVKKNRRRVI